MFTEADIEKMLIEQAQQHGWKYVPAEEVPRSMDSVMVDVWLKEALLKLNPTITPEQADQVIHKLRAAVLGVQAHDLVSANERFRDLLFEKNTYPFGKDGEHIPIRFFEEDPDKLSSNSYVITNQWCFPKSSGEGGKRLDLVLLVNGLPLVIGELKSPVRSSVSWADGAQDIQSYEQSIPQMFVPNVLTFATEGKTFRYASIGAPLAKWGPWYETEDHSEGHVRRGDGRRLRRLRFHPRHLPLSAVRRCKRDRGARPERVSEEGIDLAFSGQRKIPADGLCRTETPYAESPAIPDCGHRR